MSTPSYQKTKLTNYLNAIHQAKHGIDWDYNDNLELILDKTNELERTIVQTLNELYEATSGPVKEGE